MESNSGRGVHFTSRNAVILLKSFKYYFYVFKLSRGQLVVVAYKGLVQFPSEEMIELARVLGWCVEIVSWIIKKVSNFENG